MHYEDKLRKFLQTGKKQVFSLKKLPGSSLSETYLCNNNIIYKIDPKSEASKELHAYDRFNRKLADYLDYFPYIKLLTNLKDITIWEVEFLGKCNFESILLEYQHSEHDLVSNLNLQILAKLRRIFEKTRQKDPKQKELFVAELIEALEINITKAGLMDNGTRQQVNELKRIRSCFYKEVTVSLCHKDFTVGNIIIDNTKTSARFIDPRVAVPYLDESTANGNVAFDIIGYYVSLFRKELEKQQVDQNISFSFLKSNIEAEIINYEKEKVFSAQFKDLCFLVWYSVYAACKCEYCASLERIWLYNKMVENMRFYLGNLIENT